MPDFSDPGVHSSTPMGPRASQEPTDGKKSPTKATTTGLVLSKALFVLVMNCQASGQVSCLGLDLWWNSIMPQPPELGISLPREAGCHSPHISMGHSDSALV